MTGDLADQAGKSPWPRAIIIFFVILAIGNGLFLYLALSSQHGYLDKQPYELGLRYQETIDRRQMAQSAGLGAEFKFSAPDQVGMRNVSLNIIGLSAAGISLGDVELSALRYSDSAFDSDALLLPVGGELFQGKMKLPLNGLWLFRIKLQAGGSEYLIEQKEMLD